MQITIALFSAKDYNTYSFIEQRTALAGVKEKAEFNPQALLRTFDSALADTMKLLGEVKSSLEADAAISNDNEKESTVELSNSRSQLQHLLDTFESLDNLFDESCATSTRSGDLIDSIDKQKNRAVDARELVALCQALNSPTLEPEIRSLINVEDPDEQFRVAILFKRINSIINHCDRLYEVAKVRIDQYLEGFEQSLLSAFDKASEIKRLDIMKKCAKRLSDFNGGESVAKRYISRHEFFTAASTIPLSDIQYSQHRKTLPIDFDKPEAPLPSLQNLLDLVVGHVSRSWGEIKVVFDNSSLIMDAFVNHAFVQKIQPHVEHIIEESKNHSVAAYCRILESMYTMIQSSWQKISESYSREGFPFKCADMIADIVMRYIDNDEHFKLEIKALREVLDIPINSWRQTISARKQKMKFFGKSQPPSSFEEISVRYISLGRDIAQPFETISMTLILQMIQIFNDFITRIVRLYVEVDLVGKVRSMCSILLEYGLKKYVDNLVEIEFEELASNDKAGVDINGFKFLRTIAECLQALQLYFDTTILPYLFVAPNILKDVLEHKNFLYSNLEIKLNKFVHRQITSNEMTEYFYSNMKVITNWLADLLSKQKKADFKPKDDNAMQSADKPSDTCIAVCDYLNSLRNTSNQFLEERNAQRLMTEIGLILHTMIMDHIKKFTISESGALVLLKDLCRYQDTFKAQPMLTERYEMLRELANLYLVRPTNLRSLLNEGQLGKIEAKHLMPFVSQRGDFRTAHIEELLNSR